MYRNGKSPGMLRSLTTCPAKLLWPAAEFQEAATGPLALHLQQIWSSLKPCELQKSAGECLHPALRYSVWQPALLV